MGNEKIAFLGTGLMGFPMARHLAAAGFAVTAWNRTPTKAAGLMAHGCQVAASSALAVAQSGVIISIVTDGASLHALIDDCLDRVQPGSVWVDMSSTKASDATAAAERLSNVGAGFVDAPVSGGTRGAEGASLAIMAGGQADVVERALPILSVLGRPVHVGPTGAGQMCKLANQAIVGVTIGVVAEAQLFLEAGGVDTDAMRQALKGGFADSTILQQHGDRMATRNFEPGALSTLQHKDMLNVLDQAQVQGLHLPLVQAVADRYARYIEQLDGGNQDHAGLFEELLDLNRD